MLPLAHRILALPPNIPTDVLEKIAPAERERTLATVARHWEVLQTGQLPVIVADNVANWYAESPLRTWTAEAFPNVAPPFQGFVVEYGCPPVLLATDPHTNQPCTILAADNPILQSGYLVLSAEKTTIVAMLQEAGVHQAPAESLWEKLQETGRWSRVKWVLDISQWIALKQDGVAFPTGLIAAVGVTEEGENLGGLVLPGWFADASPDLYLPEFYPLWLTLSFMHCKNVEQVDVTVEHAPTPKWLRRKKLPSLTYRMLNVGAMRREAAGAGSGTAEDSLRRALHICRGHFAKYTDDKPLFGKYVGQFWRPAHVRGDVTQGAVVKDYAVTPVGKR